MRKVGIDSRGAYYYLDTGEEAYMGLEGEQPYDIYSGEDVMLAVADSSGTILEISSDIKDALVAIFGNANQIPPAATVPASVRTTAVITPRQVAQQIPTDGGLFGGGGITISSQTAILIGIGVLLFTFGKSRGR